MGWWSWRWLRDWTSSDTLCLFSVDLFSSPFLFWDLIFHPCARGYPSSCLLCAVHQLDVFSHEQHHVFLACTRKCSLRGGEDHEFPPCRVWDYSWEQHVVLPLPEYGEGLGWNPAILSLAAELHTSASLSRDRWVQLTLFAEIPHVLIKGEYIFWFGHFSELFRQSTTKCTEKETWSLSPRD